ncbi:MAG: helix-hairpin-helix domain-containing protein [Deltaproteobacteria bacterium]|nr:helix-hairpin-helix domain-containing protein [Deltaproteobacteria bacterium]
MKKILVRLSSFLALATLLLGLGLTSLEAKALEGTVNVNEASVEQLSLLPGVGPKTAQAIIVRRQEKPFASLEDLKSVKGIGDKRIDALKPHVTFSGASTAKVATTKTAKVKE